MSKSKKISKILLLVPIFTIAAWIEMIIIGIALECFMNTEFVLLFKGLEVAFYILAIPCIILSILGLIFALKSKKTDGIASNSLVTIAIFETVAILLVLGFFAFAIAVAEYV